MKNNGKIKDLVSIIKSARKFSLLGEYGNSLEKYQEAISIIKQRQEEISNESENIKSNWKMTEYNIKSEMLQIKDILELCLQLHNSDFTYSKKQNEGFYYLNENKKIIEKEINDMFSKNKKIFEKNSNNNNNKNINSYHDLNKQNKNKIKSKSSNTNSTNNNYFSESKKNMNKSNPFQGPKNYFNNKYNKYNNIILNYNNKNNINIKKSRSLKEPSEKKMYNPLEEFYGHKLDDNDIININKEQNLNGNNKNEKRKKIKIVSIDLDKEGLIKSNKIIKEEKSLTDKDYKKNKNNFDENNNEDMVEQALENFSKFNLDNTDDSI